MSVDIHNLSLKLKNSDKRAIRGKKNLESYLFENLSLKIEDGEFVCILGPSGSGKTTLLNILAGFITDYEGDVYSNNQLVTGPSIDRAVVFQDYALFPWLNVIENVAFGLKYSDLSHYEAMMRASRYLKLVGLLNHAKQKITDLSGGMQQRVAIARSLAVQPKLLLLDEPLGALDEPSRSRLQECLLDLWQELKYTTVLITHSVDESLLLASRIIVLNSYQNLDKANFFDLRLPKTRKRDLFSAEFTFYRSQLQDALNGYYRDNSDEAGDFIFDSGI